MILYEVSMVDLLSTTKQNFKSDREDSSSQVSVASIRYTASYKRNILTCIARVKSATSGKLYITKIELMDVEFTEESNPEHVEILGSDNRPIYIVPKTKYLTEVKVNCNCLDFYQRMASYNKSNNILIGRKVPTHYQSPTTPGNKMKGNPNNSIGMCKHLVCFYHKLLEDGLIL